MSQRQRTGQPWSLLLPVTQAQSSGAPFPWPLHPTMSLGPPVASSALTSASNSRVSRVTSLPGGVRARLPLPFREESHFRWMKVTWQSEQGAPPGNRHCQPQTVAPVVDEFSLPAPTSPSTADSPEPPLPPSLSSASLLSGRDFLGLSLQQLPPFLSSAQGTGESLTGAGGGELGGRQGREVQTWPRDSAGLFCFAFVSQMQATSGILDLEGGPLLDWQHCSL